MRVTRPVVVLAAAATLLSLTGTWPSGALPASASAAATATTSSARAAIPAPVAHGQVRISGQLRDGRSVRATGLRWRPGTLPGQDKLLSFAVSYAWKSCAATCVNAADSTATPFAADRYRAGHADTGRRLQVTETATEVVETNPATFAFSVVHASASYTTTTAVRAYPAGRAPSTEFVNGTPEQRTASTEEFFTVDPAHYNAANGTATQQYRINAGPWRALPASRVFYTGKLTVGRQRVQVRTSDAAGASITRFSWRVVPMPAPVACQPRAGHACWYPQHLNSAGKPTRWDWQIGRGT